MTLPLNTSEATLREAAGGSASIDVALAEVRRFPRAEWLDLVRSDQSYRWRRRAGCEAEEYFRGLPELQEDAEEALVVINGEIVLRGELGESPLLADYQRRFPDLSDRIAVQFEVNRLLDSFPDDGDEWSAELEDAASTIDLPGYTFLEEIGGGSAGVVYRARQESLKRDVAVKVLRTAGADEKQIARQRQEAQILGRLQHPNVVHIYEVLQSRGRLYLVMELVPGSTLAQRINARPLPPRQAAQLAQTLAETIQAVHAAGVLHRDLKPSNVLLTETGQVKVTDFGLAKLQSSSATLTAPDSIVGTPSYMPPEQAGGDHHAIGPAADVYSLGAILYELLSGRPPFLGATLLDTLSLIRTEDPVPLRRLQPRLPRDLETICLKCLAKAAKQRYETAAALADDLGSFLAGASISARPPGPVERLVRTAKRRPALAVAIACVVALAGVVAAAWRIYVAQEEQSSDAALVQAIATADAQNLPELLQRLRQGDLALAARLRRARQGVPSTEPKWVNLSVAEVTADPDAANDRLLDYLPNARPPEIEVLAAALGGRFASSAEPVWAKLLALQAPDDARLKVACLAARVAPDDPRWKEAAPAVARALVWQHPLDVGSFTAALEPVASALVPPLVGLYGDEQLEPVAREVAAGILARFAADEPAILASLIVEADPSEFRLLLPTLARRPGDAIPRLEEVAAQSVDIRDLVRDQTLGTRHLVETRFDRAQRRRALALTALWRLGSDKAPLATLRRTADPALRAWLIDSLATFGVAPDQIWTSARATDDAGVRQGLLLALGQARLEALPAAERQNLTAELLEMYRADGDPGVHAACRWLLDNSLKSGHLAAEADEALSANPSPDRDWYVGANGHTYAILRGPLEFTMGSPPDELSREEDEAAHFVTLEHSLAVGACEVTIAQFFRFRQTRYFNRRYSATDDAPANNINWFDAAAYCRWLSEQEGIPEDQMCFPPLADIRPGMRLPENWRERTGYRLPTEAEWECACRGGVQASRSCGEGKELLSRYAWFVENSDDHAWPVGQLKPNNFGLFDMHGNVTERCFEPFAPYPSGTAGVSAAASSSSATELVVEATSMRPFRGANFGDAEHNLRSARRNANLVTDEWALVGFRPVRIVKP